MKIYPFFIFMSPIDFILDHIISSDFPYGSVSEAANRPAITTGGNHLTFEKILS